MTVANFDVWHAQFEVNNNNNNNICGGMPSRLHSNVEFINNCNNFLIYK